MANKIELRIARPPREERRCVQISGKANNVLNQICLATGLPVGKIVSEMIIQGAKFIEIIEEGSDYADT